MNRLGDKLHVIWEEEREIYRTVRLYALRRQPIKFDSAHVPINILEVNEETLRVYEEYKKGELVLGVNKDELRRKTKI